MLRCEYSASEHYTQHEADWISDRFDLHVTARSNVMILYALLPSLKPPLYFSACPKRRGWSTKGMLDPRFLPARLWSS